MNIEKYTECWIRDSMIGWLSSFWRWWDTFIFYYSTILEMGWLNRLEDGDIHLIHIIQIWGGWICLEDSNTDFVIAVPIIISS